MTIAYVQYGGIGPRLYAPEGPLDITGKSGPLPSFRVGEVVSGDAEAEFVFLLFTVASAPLTVNQGDLFQWDNNGTATQLTTAAGVRGQSVGAFYLGGRYGDPAATPFSYVFPATGTYGIWVQRAGVSLLNAASTAAAGNLAETTATAGRANAPASATVGSKLIVGLYLAQTNVAFTANTANGSPTLTNISSVAGLYPGQTVTGTGIPGSTTIASINGNPGNYTITLSANATANGTSVAITANGYVEAYFKWPYVDKTN